MDETTARLLNELMISGVIERNDDGTFSTTGSFDQEKTFLVEIKVHDVTGA